MPLINDLIALHNQIFKKAPVPNNLPTILAPIILAENSILETITSSVSGMSGRLQEGQDQEKALREHITARSKESGKNALDYLLSGRLFWVSDFEFRYCFAADDKYQQFLHFQSFCLPFKLDTASGNIVLLKDAINTLAANRLSEVIEAIKTMLSYFGAQAGEAKEDTSVEPKSNPELVQLLMGNLNKKVPPALHALFTTPIDCFRRNVSALAKPIFDRIKELTEAEKRTIAMTVNNQRETIFHIVARDGDAEQLQSLYDAFGDNIFRELMQVKNKRGEIPYHLALQSEYMRVEKAKKIHLLLKGSFSTLALLPMNNGKNSLHLIFARGRVPDIQLLEPICIALENSEIDTESKEGEKTLKEQAVLATDENRENAVHLACRAGNSECFDRLLQGLSERCQNAAVSAEGTFGSALLYALGGSNTDIVFKVIAIIGPEEAYRIFTKKTHDIGRGNKGIVLESICDRFGSNLASQIALINVVIKTIGIVAVYDLINVRPNNQTVKISPQVSAGLVELFNKSIDKNLLNAYHYFDQYSPGKAEHQNQLAHFRQLLIALLTGNTNLDKITRNESKWFKSTDKYADLSDAIIASPPAQEKIRKFVKFLEKGSADHPAAKAIWDDVKAHYKPASTSEDSESKNTTEEGGLLTVPQQPSLISGGFSASSAPAPFKPSIEAKSEVYSHADEIQRLQEQLLDRGRESFQVSRKLAQLLVNFSAQLRVQDEEAMPEECGDNLSEDMESNSASSTNSVSSTSDTSSSNSNSMSSTKSSHLLGQFGSKAIHTEQSNTSEFEPGTEPKEDLDLTSTDEGQIKAPTHIH